jgi:predicted ferric reductase
MGNGIEEMVWFFIGFCINCLIGTLIGKAKGRAVSGLAWAFFLGPIGWLLVALLNADSFKTKDFKKTCWISLFAGQILITVGFWLWFHVNHPMGNQLTGDTVGQILAYGRLAGLLAVLGILFQLILISRVKWVEKIFGFDRLAHLHHFTGFSIVVLIVAHPILIMTGHSMQAGIGYFAQLKDFFVNWEDVFAAAIGLSLMIPAMILSVLVLRKMVKYEIWYYVHLIFYISIALIFGHQLSVGTDFISNKIFANYWYTLYALTFANLLYFRIIRPIIFFIRHRFRIEHLVSETGDVTSVHIGGNKIDLFPVNAGQFMFVRFLTKGFRWESHPFSMSCMPNGNNLRLSIKGVGDFTRRISGLKTGVPVFIDGPHGIFTSKSCKSSKVLMIAGGIGITPIRSLSEELSSTEHDVVLVYSNRNKASIIFERELNDLENSSSGRFKVINVITDDPGWQGEKGRLDKEKILRLVPDFKEREVFLCGPPPMMKAVRVVLSSIGVPDNQIHYERFAL